MTKAKGTKRSTGNSRTAKPPTPKRKAATARAKATPKKAAKTNAKAPRKLATKAAKKPSRAPAKAKAKKAAPPPVKQAASRPAKQAASRPAKQTPPAKAGIGTPVTQGPGTHSVSGQVYQRGQLVQSILHLDRDTGRITRVSKTQRLAEHVDYGKLAILPGGMDIHVHFREPGHTQKEDLTTGSTAAAFGGITAYVDMPNTNPPTITLQRLDEKLALMAEKSLVDYGAWAGGTWYTGELDGMLKKAVGVKTYLGSSTGDLLLDDMERFAQVLDAAGKAGKPVALHAEAERVLQAHRRAEVSVVDHDQTRPPAAEVEAIYDAMKLVGQVKKPPQIHVAHVASTDAVQAARSAKFSQGVCPHHLLLDTDTHLTHAYGKMNPPLRSPAMRQAMFEAYANGQIPILESDHAPHTKADKEDNFHSAPSGVPGVETMLPLMLALVKSKKLELQTVVDSVTKNPAKLLGLGDYGTLETNTKADYIVVDLKKTTKIEGPKLHSKCNWSPFDGQNAVFPLHTFLAAKPVVLDQALVGKPGMGRPLI